MFTFRNKSTIFILVLMMFTVLLLSSCSWSNQGASVKNEDTPSNHKGEIEKTEPLYDYGALYSYRNISLNDSAKLQELVSHLQYAKELSVDRIELKTEVQGILRIDYRMNLTPGQKYKVNHTKKMADIVILLALLDNLNGVEYNLVQEDYGYGGVPVTREQAEEVSGADIGSLGKTEEVFLTEMPKIITDLH